MGATFDTSGRVRRGVITPRGTFSFRPGFVRWTDLSPFTQGYVEALLTDVDLVGQWLDAVDSFRAPAFSDLAPETLARIMEDCERARRALNANDADGRWFWEARQRGAFTPFPPLTPDLGDDGKIYLKAHPPGGHSHEG